MARDADNNARSITAACQHADGNVGEVSQEFFAEENKQ